MRVLLVAFVAAAAALLGAAPSLAAAAFTTVNEATSPPGDGPGHCQNGNPGVNCNIYDGKQYVWLNGGPDAAQLLEGTYFFAVLAPGGQPTPNDAGAVPDSSASTPKNLSDDVDAYTNRTFTVDASGSVDAYAGSHDREGDLIRAGLAPDWYADTPNNGGVYILAICSLGDGDDYPVAPNDCKYDAFKVPPAEPGPSDLVVLKDAFPAFTRTFSWGVSKLVDGQESVSYDQTGANRTLAYGVSFTKSGPSDSGWIVSGSIEVYNPNAFTVTGVDVIDEITYGAGGTVDPNASCTLSGGSADGVGESIASEDTLVLDYSCSYSAAPASLAETNTATATWDATGDLAGTSGSADMSVPFAFSAPSSVVHDCVSVSDTMALTPSLGSLPSGSICSSQSFSYSVEVSVPFGCVTVNNTASFADGSYTGSDSASARVCRTPARTGALTIGFWQNKNGQGIVARYGGTGCQALRAWLNQFNPFSDLTATACGHSPSYDNRTASGVLGYIYTTIKVAQCTSSSKTCNSMLKAQMLATALNVYFSDPALGGNRIGAYSGLGAAQPAIGAIVIDLTQICTMLDGSSGTGSCSGSYKDVSAVFGGASSLTVMAMLTYQNAVATAGGATWYGQNKAMQVCAKDAFDAINNRAAFAL